MSAEAQSKGKGDGGLVGDKHCIESLRQIRKIMPLERGDDAEDYGMIRTSAPFLIVYPGKI